MAKPEFLALFLAMAAVPMAFGQPGGGFGQGRPGGGFGGGFPGGPDRGGGRGGFGQDQTPRTVTPPEDMGKVSGQVVDAKTGTPLGKARVVMSPVSGRRDGLRSTTTSDDGIFRFDNVEPGSYRVAVTRNLYASTAYRRRGAGGGDAIEVKKKQDVKDVLFKMTPAAVVTGRVTDEDGDPLPNVRIFLLRYSYFNGSRRLMPTSGGASTNDKGEYRVFGVNPGRYFVSASFEVGRVFTGGSESGEAYPSSYFPGVADPDQAMMITMQGGEEKHGIDFRLAPTAAVKVSGRVTGASERVMVNLVKESASVLPFDRYGSAVRPDGTFTINAVIPGSYTLTAFYQSREGSMYARLPVEVGAANLSNLELSLMPTMEIGAKVKVEPANSDPGNVRVDLRPTGGGMMMGPRGGRMEEGGVVKFQNVMAGKYLISLQSQTKGLYVKKLRVGDQWTENVEAEILPGMAGDAIEVVAGISTARVDGIVNADGKPVDSAVVVIAPDEKRRNRADLYRQVTTGQDGRFSVEGLPPGEYKAFAFSQLEPGSGNDPLFIAQHEDMGKKLEVEDKGGVTQELALIEVDPIQ